MPIKIHSLICQKPVVYSTSSEFHLIPKHFDSQKKVLLNAHFEQPLSFMSKNLMR